MNCAGMLHGVRRFTWFCFSDLPSGKGPAGRAGVLEPRLFKHLSHLLACVEVGAQAKAVHQSSLGLCRAIRNELFAT